MERHHSAEGEASLAVDIVALFDGPGLGLLAHLSPGQLALALLAERFDGAMQAGVANVTDESGRTSDFVQPSGEGETVQAMLTRAERESFDGADEEP